MTNAQVVPLPSDFVAREQLKQHPDFTFKHGAARLRWDSPQHVLVEFDYLRADNRSGELRGQITVTSNAPGSHGLLHRANLNLTSTQARTACVKQLASRGKDQGVDWNALVEQACYLTVEAHRAGEPAILLRNAERPADAGWLLPPIVLGRLPTIIFGDGGTAKSYLSLAAAISIHSGYELLSIKPSARVNVAYLDWEFDAYEHRDRMRRLVGEDMPGIVYVPCVGPLRDQVDRLQRVIREHDLGFVVIDSVGMACEGPPEEAQSALGFFDALRSLQVGALCVAHVNRSGDTDRPFARRSGTTRRARRGTPRSSRRPRLPRSRSASSIASQTSAHSRRRSASPLPLTTARPPSNGQMSEMSPSLPAKFP
jgi:hypothetical protein